LAQLFGNDLLQVRAGVRREKPNRIQDGILIGSARFRQDGNVQRTVAVRVTSGKHGGSGMVLSPKGQRVHFLRWGAFNLADERARPGLRPKAFAKA